MYSITLTPEADTPAVLKTYAEDVHVGPGWLFLTGIVGRRTAMAGRSILQGRYYEDFEVGDVYEHPYGRTIIDADNVWFTNLTMKRGVADSNRQKETSTDWCNTRSDICPRTELWPWSRGSP